jgi:hypothetical protein
VVGKFVNPLEYPHQKTKVATCVFGSGKLFPLADLFLIRCLYGNLLPVNKALKSQNRIFVLSFKMAFERKVKMLKRETH